MSTNLPRAEPLSSPVPFDRAFVRFAYIIYKQREGLSRYGQHRVRSTSGKRLSRDSEPNQTGRRKLELLKFTFAVNIKF